MLRIGPLARLGLDVIGRSLPEAHCPDLRPRPLAGRLGSLLRRNRINPGLELLLGFSATWAAATAAFNGTLRSGPRPSHLSLPFAPR